MQYVPLRGGALGKILPIFQLYAGGPLGSGKQWLSWIHRGGAVQVVNPQLTRSLKALGFNPQNLSSE
jgi:NAD dependent epimerase/dehydratase family enzyme